MMKIPFDKLKDWEVFNTPYKIKFKGIIKTIGAINNTFLIESHGTLYGIEINIQDSMALIYDEIKRPQDLDFLLDTAIVCYKYEKELNIDKKAKDFKSNIFSLQEKTFTTYDRRTCTARKINVETIDLNPDICKELDDVSDYKVDKFELVKSLFNIKNSSLDDIIESKKILGQMMEELNKIEEINKKKRTLRAEPIDDYDNVLDKLTEITTGMENLLKKQLNDSSKDR